MYSLFRFCASVGLFSLSTVFQCFIGQRLNYGPSLTSTVHRLCTVHVGLGTEGGESASEFRSWNLHEMSTMSCVYGGALAYDVPVQGGNRVRKGVEH